MTLSSILLAISPLPKTNFFGANLLMSLVLLLILVGMMAKDYKLPKFTKVLSVSIVATLFACLSDAFVSVPFPPELPSFLHHLVLYYYWISGDVLLFFFIWYGFVYVDERKPIKWAAAIFPLAVLSLCTGILTVMCLKGELYTIEDGVVTSLSNKPLFITLANVVSILYLLLFGWTKRSVIGKQPLVLIAIFGFSPFLMRYYAVNYDGHDYTYLGAGIAMIVAYLFLDNQITEKKLQEQNKKLAEANREQQLLNEIVNAEKQRQEHFHNIISQSGNGVWTIIQQDGKPLVMECDTMMKKLLGLDPDKELTPQEIYDFWFSRITPEAIPSVMASVAKMKQGYFDENTYLWQHPQQGEIYVRCGGRAKKMNDGSFRISGYHADVTEIVMAEKKAAAELSKAREDAEAANAAKTSFLFSMSHDIRTPMNAIIGFTNLLRKHQDDSQKREDYLDKIEHSSGVLLSIINNVLEMARIERGTVEMQETVISTGEIADTVFNSTQMLMAGKDIDFRYSVRLKHEYILGDTIRMGELFDNILSNAYKYTLTGGKVEVSVEELPGATDDTVNVRTTISDTGIGMSEEFLPHLFEEFSRENSTTDNKIEGTGLGMPIVKRLVELMQGTIEVKSQKGVGTTFIVTLPHKIADGSQLKTTGRKVCDLSRFEGKRILLAEDNDLNAEIAIEILQEQGFAVERAADGKQCVEMLSQAPAAYYDIILMDVQMPVMNGYEATRSIRSLSDTIKANIPILAMTANAFNEDKVEAVRMGMNGHLAKPINISELQKLLAAHLA